jgi:expansin
VPGPLTVRVKEGSSQYWLALRFDNHGNALTAAEIKVGSGFQRLEHTDYNYWLDQSGAGNGPFTVRLTDSAGHQTTVAGVRLSVATVQRTGVNMYSGAAAAQPASATPARTAASSPAASAPAAPTATASSDAAAPGENAAEAPPTTTPVEAGCKT